LEIRDYGMEARTSRRWWRQWVANPNLVIHPTDRVRFIHLYLAIPQNLPNWPDLHLEYFAAAEHSEPHEGELNVTGQEIHKQAVAAFAWRPAS
jgi:hypothetical protein